MFVFLSSLYVRLIVITILYLYVNIYFFFLLTFNVDFISNFAFIYTFILLRQAIGKLPNREVYICMFNIFMNKNFKTNYHVQEFQREAWMG